MKHLLLTTIAAVVLVGTVFADPIHDAARNGDLAGVQAELDKGVDVDEGDDSWPEMTPCIMQLMKATRKSLNC